MQKIVNFDNKNAKNSHIVKQIIAILINEGLLVGALLTIDNLIILLSYLSISTFGFIKCVKEIKNSQKSWEDTSNVVIDNNSKITSLEELLAKEETKDNTKEKKNDILSYEEIMGYLAQLVEQFYYRFKMPPYKLDPNDWDKIFDTVYKYFVKQEIEYAFENFCYDYLEEIFAKAYSNKEKEVNLESFMDSLSTLEWFTFTKRDVLKIKQEILQRCNKEVIDFSKVRKIKD